MADSSVVRFKKSWELKADRWQLYIGDRSHCRKRCQVLSFMTETTSSRVAVLDFCPCRIASTRADSSRTSAKISWMSSRRSWSVSTMASFTACFKASSFGVFVCVTAISPLCVSKIRYYTIIPQLWSNTRIILWTGFRRLGSRYAGGEAEDV